MTQEKTKDSAKTMADFKWMYDGDVSDALAQQESMLINEISLVLAEKRTALSILRTGLSVLVLPLSVLSVLVVISRYYDPQQVIYLLVPLLSVCAVLGVFGFYLIYKSWRRIRHFDLVVAHLKKQNPYLLDLCGYTDSKKDLSGPR